MTEIIQPNRTVEEEKQLVNIHAMMGVETLVPSPKGFQCRSLTVNSVVQQLRLLSCALAPGTRHTLEVERKQPASIRLLNNHLTDTILVQYPHSADQPDNFIRRPQGLLCQLISMTGSDLYASTLIVS